MKLDTIIYSDAQKPEFSNYQKILDIWRTDVDPVSADRIGKLSEDAAGKDVHNVADHDFVPLFRVIQ